VRNRTGAYWRAMSLPYPEPAIRLVRQHAIDAFNNQLAQFKAELDDAVDRLDERYVSSTFAARDRLGTLYDDSDYPASLVGLFDVT